MKWEDLPESRNVEDRRGMGVKTGAAGLGGGAIIVALLYFFITGDPNKARDILVQQGQQQQRGADNGQPWQASPEEERLAQFSKKVFGSTEVVWTQLFQEMGQRYQKPILVLFAGRVDSACGTAESAMGPFYCPGDSRVYIDLSFFSDDMIRQLKAPGEFARAYVIAHEVGHHVQRQLGYADIVDRVRQTSRNKVEVNHATVRLELQADYLAGVWANRGQREFNFLQDGDVKSAMKAAFEIGDDTLQKKSTGVVRPDAFTHGKSEQRMRWFSEGMKTGDVKGAAKLFKLRYEEL